MSEWSCGNCGQRDHLACETYELRNDRPLGLRRVLIALAVAVLVAVIISFVLSLPLGP